MNVSAGPNTEPSGTVTSLTRDTRSQFVLVAVGSGVLVGVLEGVSVAVAVFVGVLLGVEVSVGVGDGV